MSVRSYELRRRLIILILVHLFTLSATKAMLDEHLN